MTGCFVPFLGLVTTLQVETHLHRVWKHCALYFCLQLCQMLIDVHNSSTGRLSGTFLAKRNKITNHTSNASLHYLAKY